MPWHWRIALSGAGAAQPSLAAVEAATDTDSDFEDVFADSLKVQGDGDLVFRESGSVKVVVAKGTYTSVVRLEFIPPH